MKWPQFFFLISIERLLRSSGVNFSDLEIELSLPNMSKKPIGEYGTSPHLYNVPQSDMYRIHQRWKPKKDIVRSGHISLEIYVRTMSALNCRSTAHEGYMSHEGDVVQTLCVHISQGIYERIRQWPVTDISVWPLVNESSLNKKPVSL